MSPKGQNQQNHQKLFRDKREKRHEKEMNSSKIFNQFTKNPSIQKRFSVTPGFKEKTECTSHVSRDQFIHTCNENHSDTLPCLYKNDKLY